MRIIILTLSLLLFQFDHGNAQSGRPWFSSASNMVGNLPPIQSQRVNALRSHPLTRSLLPIQIEPLQTVQQQGMLIISLPNEPRRYPFQLYSIKYESEEDYEVRGNLNLPNFEGELHVMMRKGAMLGALTINDRYFDILDLDQGNYYLREYEDITQSPTACNGPNETTVIDKASITEVARTEGINNPVVTVLVLFTPEADINYDIPLRAEMDISDLNQILENSRIGTDELKFELVGVYPWEHDESYYPDEDLTDLKDDNYVASIRESLKADIVVAYTERRNLLSNNLTYQGATAQAFLDSEQAHAIVDIDFSVQKYNFAHFVFHMFGCDHSSDGDGPSWAHAFEFWAWDFIIKRWYRTVVSSSDYKGIMHISNPYVNYKGKATGWSPLHNNARQVREAAPILCEYRSFPPTFTAFIQGPSSGTPDFPLTWTVGTSNCNGTPTIRWETSTDGFNFQVSGYGESFTYSLPYENDLYIRIKAKCDNQVYTDYLTVVNTSYGCTYCSEILQREASQKLPFELYPNPAREEVQLKFTIPIQGTYQIQILSITGKKVYHAQYEAPLNTISLPSLPSGGYQVQLISENESYIRTLWIRK